MTRTSISGMGRTTPWLPGIVRCGATALALAGLNNAAVGQLIPDRAYYGIGRVMQMTVKVPADPRAAGESVVQLLVPVTGEVKGTASVTPGGIDLAALFPNLWDIKVPRTNHDVLYAQLLVGTTKVGPPVILQPLVEPDICVFIDAQTQEPQYRLGRGIYSGLRTYVDQHVVMETTLGTIRFAMRPDQAPNTVWNFMDLCRGGYYTDISFHRVVPLNESNQKPFVIQGGDPNFGHAGSWVGEGGPGYQINLEKSALPHDFGVLSMARSTKLPNSGGSQFFICLSREGTSHLDGQFATFGQAVSGADVIQQIAAVAVDKESRPRESVVIKGCHLVNAPPFGEGPRPVIAPSPAPVGR